MKAILAYVYLLLVALFSYFVTGWFILLIEMIFPPVVTLGIVLSIIFFPWFWGAMIVRAFNLTIQYLVIPTIRTLYSAYCWVKAPIYQPTVLALGGVL